MDKAEPAKVIFETRTLTEQEIVEMSDSRDWTELSMDGGSTTKRIKGVLSREIVVAADTGLTSDRLVKVESSMADESGIYRILSIKKHQHQPDMVVAAVERIHPSN